MKKTLIAAAVAASVIAPISAHAVNSAADDAGEALIYPYYNVNQGNQTFIGVVNTTNHAKVLKVRFREAVESEDVFDFQLWLSAHDHWTAVLNQINGQVRVSTADLSCTVPQVINNPSAVFNATRVPAIYTGNVLDRISEGHAEVIEMAALAPHGVVGVGELVTAITHVNGVPADCTGPINFNNQGRVVRVEGTAVNNGWGASFNQPLGGVYGISAVFNPLDGTYFTYTAEALEQFAAQPIFYPQTEERYDPGPDHTADLFLGAVQILNFDLPDLSTPDSLEGIAAPVEIIGQAFSSANGALPLDPDLITRGFYTTDGVGIADNLGNLPLGTPTGSNAARKKRDAVTTALMGVRIINDYLTGDLYDTDWVFTFPGRYLYRLPFNTLTTYPMELPFNSVVDRTTGRGCEEFGTNILYGREEEQLIGDNIGFSPGIAPDVFALCYEVNVIAVNDPSAFGTPTSALGSIAVRADATSSQLFGWADFGLENHALRDDRGGVGIIDPDPLLGNQFHLGMPVIGFAAITESKGDVDRGGAFMHKIKRGVAVNVEGTGLPGPIDPDPEPVGGLPPIL